MVMSRLRTNAVTDEQIISEYEKDHAIHRVADTLGVGGSTVNRVLIKHGIARTGLQEYRNIKKYEPWTGVYNGSTEEILGLYKSGMSMKDIAKKIGRSTHVVLRRVKQAGISRTGIGPEQSNWSGGRNLTAQGYWRQWISETDPMSSMRNHHGYVLEHRLVLARKLGRPLLSTETVHHVDGDQLNNDLINLELRQGKHGKHVVMHCMDCGSRNIGHTTIGGSKSV